jgi:hypothetical protein
MLADEILATIMDRPGISAPEIRAAFPTINRNSLADAIGRLLEDATIVTVSRGRYRAVKAETPKQTPARPMPLQSSITPASLARLMAGR